MLDGSNNRILGYSPPFKNGMAAKYVLGQSDFLSRTCQESRNGICPDGEGGIGTDAKGDVWVADSFNNRLLEFVPGKKGFVNGQNAAVVLGQSDFMSDAPGKGASGLNEPEAIASDSAGNLYVGDGQNCRVVIFKPNNGAFTNGQNASGVLGEPTLNTETCAVSQTGLSFAISVAYTPLSF